MSDLNPRGSGAVDPALIRGLRLLPSPYLQYYFHRRKTVAAAQGKAVSTYKGKLVETLHVAVARRLLAAAGG